MTENMQTQGFLLPREKTPLAVNEQDQSLKLSSHLVLGRWFE